MEENSYLDQDKEVIEKRLSEVESDDIDFV